jgi:cholera toxin transcriptional activator
LISDHVAISDPDIAQGAANPGAKLPSVSEPSQISRVSGVARFGIFEADLDTREIRKQGRRLRLQEQPFSLLAILLERPGIVVTREELRQKLWPADTFVDFDHSLNTAVKKIREALGDSAINPRFVETVARRGYRLLGEVEWADRPGLPANKTAEGNVVRKEGLPSARRGVTRLLFILIQSMYLIFYVEALLHWQGVDRVSWDDTGSPLIFIFVLVTAAAGIPVRFYLLSAAAFDYPLLGEKFKKIFLAVLALDELWAIGPFLMVERIGFGGAFAATAALVYVPFAERTLVRMAYQPND